MQITVELFKKRYSGERVFIPISDLPKELLIDDNNIMIHVEEGEFDSNGWNEGATYVRITTLREQTEEEKQEFLKHLDELKIKRKEERYKEYLKLKKEFENEQL